MTLRDSLLLAALLATIGAPAVLSASFGPRFLDTRAHHAAW